MNTIEKLLKFDANKLETPTKKITLSLKRFQGQKFEFECKALSSEAMAEVQEEQAKYLMNSKSKTVEMKLSMHKSKLMKLLYGCEIFKNQDLINHYKAGTPFGLMQKLLLPGDMDELCEVIDNLSGFDSDDIEEDIENL